MTELIRNKLNKEKRGQQGHSTSNTEVEGEGVKNSIHCVCLYVCDNIIYCRECQVCCAKWIYT